MKLPDGWKKVKFGDVVNKINDKVPNRDEWAFDRFIGGEHFDEGEIRVTRSAPIEGNEEVIGSAFHMRFKPGQVLYVTRNPRLRKGGMVDFEGVCSNVSFVMEADEKRLLQSLLPFVIQTEDFVKHTCNNAHGSTNPFLNWKDIAKYEFLLPPLEEQKKISEVLWSIENVILKTQEKFGLLNRYRRIQIRDLLSKGTNSMNKKTPDNWVKKKILDFCYIKGRVGWKGLKKSEFTDEGPYLITGVDFTEEDRVDWEKCFHINKQRYDESPEIIVKLNDILITKDGTIGKIAFIDKLPDKSSLNSHLLLVRTNNEVHPRYLYFYFKSKMFESFIEKEKIGSTRPAITQRKFESLEINIPPENEQKIILNLLEVTHARMENEKNYLIKIKELKNKLSNELLKGELRLD